jgi:hypothetical protein
VVGARVRFARTHRHAALARRRGSGDIEYDFHLAPGETKVYGASPWIRFARVSDIVKDRPPGVYYFTVQLCLSRPDVCSPEFPAGDLTLPVASP